MLGGLEADPQFQRLDIEQEKTYLCVVRFSELHGTFLLKGGSAGVIMPMHLPPGLYVQAALASYSCGREALCVAFIIGDCVVKSNKPAADFYLNHLLTRNQLEINRFPLINA